MVLKSGSSGFKRFNIVIMVIDGVEPIEILVVVKSGE